MDVVLALVAALCFSLGTVLQQQVASRASADEAGSAGFLLRLTRQPRWLAGLAADALGFVAQAVALAIGRLVVVQPLLATSVVFSLPLAARLGGRKVSRREVAAALAVTVALGVFLVAANPTGGREDATARAWIASFVVTGVLCAVLVLAARGRSRKRRAALVGMASGILFGLTAGLTKAVVERFDEGVLSVVGDWHLFALIVAGYAATALSQSSLQTGSLGPAVGSQMSLNPIASLLLGTLAFDETIHESSAGLALALAALAVMLAGLVALVGRESS